MTYVASTFTADDSAILSTKLTAEFQAIEDALGQAGDLETNAAFLGDGRIVGSDPTLYQPTVTGSPSLAILLKDGARYMVDGRLHTLDGDVTIGEVPANKTEGVWAVLVAEYDEDAETWSYSATFEDADPGPGTGRLGLLVTDSDSVTSLTLGDEEDRIPDVPTLQTLGGGGGGGGGSDVTLAMFNALEARVTALEAEVQALKDAGSTTGAVAVDLQSDIVAGDLMHTTTHLAGIDPSVMDNSSIVLMAPGLSGHAEERIDGEEAPDARAGGNGEPDYLTHTIS